MFIFWKTNYFQLWVLYKSDLRISTSDIYRKKTLQVPTLTLGPEI